MDNQICGMKLITAILMLVCLESVALAYDWPSNLFEDQFETATVKTWFTHSAGVTVATNGYSGLYSTKCEVGGYLTSPGFDNSNSNTWFSMRFKIESLALSDGGLAAVLSAAKTGVGELATLYVSQSAGKWYLKAGTAGTTELATNTWYHIDAVYSTNQFTVFLNDTEEISVALTQTQLPNEIRAGIASVYLCPSGTIYIDDCYVSPTRLASSTPELKLYAPDFNGRTGVRVLAVSSGLNAGDNIVYTWNGQTRTNGAATGRDMLRLSLVDMASGTYTNTVEIRAANNTVRTSQQLVWTKAYTGNPSFAIDEENFLLLSNTRVFPITGFATSLSWIEDWATNRLMNHGYGQAFWQMTYSNGVTMFSNYLHSMGDENLWCMGPTATGAGSKTGAATDLTNGMVLTYITNLMTMTNLSAWDWVDEPDENEYTATDYKGWTDLVKANDPIRPVHVNFMGQEFSPVATDVNNALGHSYCWPWLVADIYSMDMYPYEYTNGYTMNDMAAAVVNLSQWNYDLVSTMAYVACADVRVAYLGGQPTTNQINLMAWTCVIQGAKGIHWYPYQSMDDAARPAMTAFNDDVQRFKGVILTTNDVPVTSSSTNVYVKAMSKTGTNYLFVANVAKTSTTFALSGDVFTSGQSYLVHNGGRDVTAGSGTMTDTLPAETAVIYYTGNRHGKITIPGKLTVIGKATL